MFGELPAVALYARHVEGLELHDVKFHTRAPDARELVTLDDVTLSEL